MNIRFFSQTPFIGNFLFLARQLPQWVRASSFKRFLDHERRRTTVDRTPTDEWSARRRDLYLTIHNTHNKQTSIPPVGFEPTISACERPQTNTLDRAATGIGLSHIKSLNKHTHMYYCSNVTDFDRTYCAAILRCPIWIACSTSSARGRQRCASV